MSDIKSSTIKQKATDPATFDRAANEIANAGRFLAAKGWSPATSSNYSIRLTNEQIAITKTGVDKYSMTSQDVIIIDNNGQVIAPEGERSSAETLIHTTIYKLRPEAHAVLHTHSPRNTRLSLHFALDHKITFTGYEMQKGITGEHTHDGHVTVPILANAQDMTLFAVEVEKLLHTHPQIQSFLIAGHGLYTWAQDMSTTRRHVEALEFLFECKTLEIMGI